MAGKWSLCQFLRGFLFFVDGSQKMSIYIPFLVRSPKDGELLGLERGTTIQVSNIMLPQVTYDHRSYHFA